MHPVGRGNGPNGAGSGFDRTWRPLTPPTPPLTAEEDERMDQLIVRGPPATVSPHVWVEATSQAGRTYYYHAISRQVTWARPQGIDGIQMLLQAEYRVLAESIIEYNRNHEDPAHRQNPDEELDLEAPEPPPLEPQAPEPPPLEPQEVDMQNLPNDENNRGEGEEGTEAAERKKTEAEERAEKSEEDEDKPMWTLPITGTPWFVVWTRDDNVFYHNASDQLWVKDRPKELYERLEVDAAILNPPQLNVLLPKLEKAAAGWETNEIPDGRRYYYHTTTWECVSDMPEPLKELQTLKALLKPGPEIDVVEGGEGEEGTEAAERKKTEAEERAEKSEEDEDKPMWTLPITGTPWSVVWTRNGNVFYNNALDKLSVENRPKELYERLEVDEAILNPPQLNVLLPKLEKAAAGWETNETPDGRRYYYHTTTWECVSDMPEPLKELQTIKALLKPGPEVDVVEGGEGEEGTEAAERKKTEAEERAEKSEQDEDEPMWTLPITGTPWSVVWTSNGNVFYHNASDQLSVENRPKELYGRLDVDAAILNPPQVNIE